jgi:hypothetical protein
LKTASQLDPADVRTLDAIHLDAAIGLKKRDRIGAVLAYE